MQEEITHGEENAAAPKGGRGGARAGAGRKRSEGRDCAIGMKISRLAKANLEAYARERGISLPEALNGILERL